jgi:integrase
MARKPSVWFRKQTGWYMTTIRGKKIKLSENKDEAERAFHALLSKEPEEARETSHFPTFRKVADLFLKHSEGQNKPNTFRMHQYFLQSFCDHVKKKRVADLKVNDVTQWLAKPKAGGEKWGPSSACSAKTAVLACLNWAEAEGLISGHPLGKLKRGSHRRRERVFTGEEMKKIREFTNPRFAEFLLGLELTGARPFSELAKLTAEMIDWEARVIRLAEHKNEGKGKTRTIYLVPQMVELLKTLAERHPTGLLFRNCKGKMWTSHDATRRLHFCTDRLGIKRGTIYAVRHQVINNALAKGLTSDVIAELVGNSPITIARHYSHLDQKRAAMLEAAKKAVG